jgi:hypothetical protein
MKHGPIYPAHVLYPAVLPPPARRRAIEQAVTKVVESTKPASLCQCGKFCATHRRLATARRSSKGVNPSE